MADRSKQRTGKTQIVPTRVLADAMAQEWRAQPSTIDADLFKLRDHADFAIDLVASDPTSYIEKLVAFLETDTLCYRADCGTPFFERQEERWEPLVSAFEHRENVMMKRICGVMHHAQPAETIAAIRKVLAGQDSFALGAMLAMTSLSSSLIIGMAAIQRGADIDSLWSAANLEEDWQIEQWGADSEAAAVRKRRTADFANAHHFYRCWPGNGSA